MFYGTLTSNATKKWDGFGWKSKTVFTFVLSLTLFDIALCTGDNIRESGRVLPRSLSYCAIYGWIESNCILSIPCGWLIRLSAYMTVSNWLWGWINIPSVYTPVSPGWGEFEGGETERKTIYLSVNRATRVSLTWTKFLPAGKLMSHQNGQCSVSRPNRMEPSRGSGQTGILRLSRVPPLASRTLLPPLKEQWWSIRIQLPLRKQSCVCVCVRVCKCVCVRAQLNICTNKQTKWRRRSTGYL